MEARNVLGLIVECHTCTDKQHTHHSHTSYTPRRCRIHTRFVARELPPSLRVAFPLRCLSGKLVSLPDAHTRIHARTQWEAWQSSLVSTRTCSLLCVRACVIWRSVSECLSEQSPSHCSYSRCRTRTSRPARIASQMLTLATTRLATGYSDLYELVKALQSETCPQYIFIYTCIYTAITDGLINRRALETPRLDG